MLGPPVCENCELVADYHKNKEDPNKQGDWLCPKCGFECNSFILNYSVEDQRMIYLATDIYNENKGRGN
jgi:transposase-like protein